jgi:hypothetical protein
MEINDYPMHCCGIVEASNLSLGSYVYDRHGGYVRNINDEDYDRMFAKIEEHQRKYQRNCAMITLSSNQRTPMRAALRNGYKEVFKFFNPNSYALVSVLVKTLWSDVEEYEKAVSSGSHTKADAQYSVHGVPIYTVNVINVKEEDSLHAM